MCRPPYLLEFTYGNLAQLVERLTEDQRVGGSIPSVAMEGGPTPGPAISG